MASSTSDVSHIASESAVSSFLSDYFCTSEAWSVYTSGNKVIESINGWLSAQTHRGDARFNKERGYVCTFSALVFKAFTAHLFHVGDSRIYLVRGDRLEQLTKDHRSWTSAEQSYLSRALGVNHQVDVDYQTAELEVGDYFILCTDGVYEYIDAESILAEINAASDDLNDACQSLVEKAIEKGSLDNLTIQIVKIEQLPDREHSSLARQI